MRKLVTLTAALLIVAALVTPTAIQAACFHCDRIFNSWFCFGGFPGRENCVDTLTFCSLSGAFCDQIIVIG